MSKIDLIIDALSVAQNSVWSALNQEALAYAIELKAELAKLEQEPIGWFLKDHLETYMESYKDIKGAIPLYTAPQRKEWVGLTDGEMESLVTQAREVPVEIPCDSFTTRLLKLAEQILKEKNT